MSNFSFLLLTLTFGFPAVCRAELTVNAIFSDGAVLQRDARIAIWGTADPGGKVLVSFLDGSATATANADGTWKASLKPMSASTQPATLRIKSGLQTVAFDNVLVGDVWLCTGQSNMGFKLENCTDGKTDAANASDDLVRVNKYRGTWQPCVGEAAEETSGVAYYFARKRREMEPDVPVGLILRALSGSPIEAWTPTEALSKIDFARKQMARFEAASDLGKRWQTYALEEVDRKRSKRKGEKKAGKRPTFDGDSDTKVLAEIYYEGNPGRLWRERIKPLVGYTLAGVIWYQGERNSKAGEMEASSYRVLLTSLIISWRAAWGQGDFRFLAVQLPPFAKGGPNWRIVQQCQMAAVKNIDNAECIELYDLPDDGLLHPPNKRPVGERLAENATLR